MYKNSHKMYQNRLPHDSPDNGVPTVTISHPTDERNIEECSWNQCQDRVRRLDSMNSILESCERLRWSACYDFAEPGKMLKQNSAYPALIRKLLHLRLMPNETGLGSALRSQTIDHATDISGQARICGPEFLREITILFSLRQQSIETVLAMLRSASEDVPLCKEEVDAILGHLNLKFQASLKGIVNSMEALSSQKKWSEEVNTDRERSVFRPEFFDINTLTTICRSKRLGHLSAETIFILENWLVQNFERPCTLSHFQSCIRQAKGPFSKTINTIKQCCPFRLTSTLVCRSLQ